MNKYDFVKDMKIIPCSGNTNKYYVELPDGYRLIYEDGKYVGRYDSKLNCVI